jgi:hypothetical protein
LKLYEQCQLFGVPIFAGGAVDQPYIHSQLFKVCSDIVAVYKAIEEASANADRPPTNK